MKNILVIKLRYIGDVLLATPVLRALKAKFPQARLTMAVNRGTEDVLRRNPDVDEIVPVERRGMIPYMQFLADMRRRRFDCVIDLTDGDRSAVLAWATAAPVRIGLNDEHRWRGLLYTAVAKRGRDSVHRIDQDLDALRAIGLDPGPILPVLKTSEHDDQEAAKLLEEIAAGTNGSRKKGPLVILQPSARYWFKAWPAERFAELADRLTASFDCQVVIGGTEQDRPLAESIQSKARSRPVNIAGRTTLLQHAAVLKRCQLFVGNDNGPMHMAAALDVPVIALFGPSNPAEWGPRGGCVDVIYKGLDCRRCFHPTCERGEQSCMKQITVEEVFSIAQRSLAARIEWSQERQFPSAESGR
jgi:predicted lipopolysaccharide heptosyltransferase III